MQMVCIGTIVLVLVQNYYCTNIVYREVVQIIPETNAICLKDIYKQLYRRNTVSWTDLGELSGPTGPNYIAKICGPYR